MDKITEDKLFKYLKGQEDVRISHCNKWLVWANEHWLVLYRGYGQRNNRCLYSGDNFGDALDALMSEDRA